MTNSEQATPIVGKGANACGAADETQDAGAIPDRTGERYG